ncbi:hypothetical protein KUV56_08860 [Ferrimonas balearica]|uniref:hypothetical protein n=1 Tax=Ferrimonas balearica TaxID=44012 RepID=UPI001C5A196F|nr:hypothetical protein [Ferrimonas balearica]MBW3139625.1 hypothetical protein [Ferrimonas balearica]
MASLVEAYETCFGLGEHSSTSALRKWLYRRLIYMVKLGFLERVQAEDAPVTYFVSQRFIEVYPVDDSSSGDANGSATIDALKGRISRYHVDMLSFAGECKEYQQLVIDCPHLRYEIEQMHLSAKERGAELSGHIRAINNVLEQISTS